MPLATITDIELIGAKDAAKILGVNQNRIYKLWSENKLTWWSIGGTKKTTKEAIADFLQRTQCTDLCHELPEMS